MLGLFGEIEAAVSDITARASAAQSMTDAQTALFGVTCDLCDVLAALATAATEGESPLENELHAAEALIDRVFAQCRRETRHVVGAAEVLRNLHGLLAALDTAIINQAIGTPTPAAANANAFPNVGDEGFICLFVCCLFFGCFFFFLLLFPASCVV